jgi:hypothetical protein
MPNMNKHDFIQVIEQATADTTAFDDTFMRINEDLLDRYEGNPYGNEQPLRSQVISNDVMDTVESDMPSNVRVFLGQNEVLKFKPKRASDPDDVQEAEDKTKYVDWQIRKQPWSYPVLHGWMKNAEIQKTGVVKYYMEETQEVETHRKSGYNAEELAMFEESLNGEDVESVEISQGSEPDEDDRFDVEFKVTKTRKQVKIKNIKLERFMMTTNAESKDDAEVVGDIEIITRGDLLKRGISRNLINTIPMMGITPIVEGSRLEDIRDEDEGGSDDEAVFSDWALEKVEIQNLYITVDYDQDGIAERREVIRSGEVIISNEVFNHVPYAILSTILMPHKAIGKSRAEIAAPTAKIKTAVLRGMMDNMYAVGSPRMAASNKVNMDDLLVSRPQGIIRVNDESPVTNHLLPVTVPYIGDKSLQVIQYLDQAKAQTTGSQQASQGLNADDIGKETATRFEGVEKSLKAKIELVNRTIAETGMRQLYEGVAWIDANFQDSETEIEVLGNELSVNPADWKLTHSVESNVGLGIGDDEETLQIMTGFLQISQQLQATNSPLTDQVKIYNMLDDLTNASGLSDISRYFNDPNKPEELLKAQNEQLTQMVEAMQQQLQQMQNPLAEAETIKAQTELIKAQGKAQLDIAQMREDQRQFNEKLAEDQRQFNAETALNVEKHNETLAARLTELELKHNKDVPGAAV